MTFKQDLPHWARDHLEAARKVNPFFVNCMEEVNLDLDDICSEDNSMSDEMMGLSDSFKEHFGGSAECQIGTLWGFGKMINKMDFGDHRNPAPGVYIHGKPFDAAMGKAQTKRLLKLGQKSGHEKCELEHEFMRDDKKYRDTRPLMIKSCQSGVTAALVNVQACYKRKINSMSEKNLR